MYRYNNKIQNTLYCLTCSLHIQREEYNYVDQKVKIIERYRNADGEGERERGRGEREKRERRDIKRQREGERKREIE